MLTKKRFLLLSLLVIFAMLIAACGGGDAEENTNENTAAQPEATEDTGGEETGGEETGGEETGGEETSGDMVTINIYANGENEREYSAWLESEYEAMHPDVDIVFVDAGRVVEDRLGVYLQIFEAESAELDVAQIDVIWPGDLAEHFVDLNEYGAADVTGDYFAAIVENNTVDGQLIGIPWFTDAGLLYYRTDLLEKYGYDAPPATWDELEDMARTIQEGEREGNADFDGFVWQGRAYEGLTCDALEWIDSHGGGSIVSPDGLITINNDNAVAALERAAGWIGDISPVGVTDYAEEEARGQWQAGNAAFMRNWPYAYSLGNADDSVIAGLFDVAPLPAGPDGTPSATLGGWQLAVSKYSEHPDVAADFALFAASYEGQKQNAIMTSRIPTIEALYSDEDVLAAYPWFGSLFDVFTNAVARPSTATAPNYSATSAVFFNAVNSVLVGDTDAETAVAEIELDLQDLLGFESGSQ